MGRLLPFHSSSSKTQFSSDHNIQDLKNLLDLAQKDKDELACKLESAQKEIEHLNQKLLRTKTSVLNQGLSSSKNNHSDKKEESYDDLLKSEKQLRSKFEHQLQEMRNAENSAIYEKLVVKLEELVLSQLSKMLSTAKHDFNLLANLRNQKGVYLSYLKRYEEAINEFSKAIFIDSTSSNLFLNRAQTYFCMKDYNKSLEDVLKALELKKDDKDAAKLLNEIENALESSQDEQFFSCLSELENTKPFENNNSEMNIVLESPAVIMKFEESCEPKEAQKPLNKFEDFKELSTELNPQEKKVYFKFD